jgi:thermopsin
MRAYTTIVFSVLYMLLWMQPAHALVNPVAIANISTALPVGIASYGLYNISGSSGPYVVTTNEIFGYARISSMYAYNSSLGLNASPYGVSLQLNAIINISSNGNNYSYWTQDVADFNVSNSTYYFVDNIWNVTNLNAIMSNGTVQGRGNVSDSFTPLFNYTTNQTLATNSTFYSYSTNSTLYTLPLYFKPVMRLIYNHGYPYLQLGYLQGESAVFYDNVTFLIPNSVAYFIVNPYAQTPSEPIGPSNGSFYDVELVFGGEGSGVNTYFGSMNSSLWIGYLRNGTIIPFPAVATFGGDTSETASNLAVMQSNGMAVVTTGQLDYNKTITLSGVPPGMFSPALPAARLTVPTTSIPAPVPPSSVQSFSYIDALGAFALIVIAIVAYFYVKAREGES